MKTIAVAMSGGVDSSVVAAKMSQQYKTVFGFTMVCFDDKSPFRCDVHQKSIADASSVCEKLGIEHFTIDVRAEFSSIVLDNFFNEYKLGRTPNPCALCNPTIKWGVFVEKITQKLGIAPTFATGHFAEIIQLPSGLSAIKRATDVKKDQTYMLWRLSQDQIANTIFPLHRLTKSEVRQIATELHLEVAEKKDSQDICFLDGKYTDFLSNFQLNTIQGDIVFENQKKIGTHTGIPHYTIGQRKGLPAWNKPLYVLSINSTDNSIIVTDDLTKLHSDKFFITDINWQQNTIPTDTTDLSVQIRYRSKPISVKRLQEVYKDKIEATLCSPASAITPGQSAVFYRGDILLGGGIIN
jgi:tRNA-specific 2-thiouridylase